MRRNKGSGRDEVEPEQLEKDSNVKTGMKISGKSSPKQTDDERPFKQADAQRTSKQGEEGKKKATMANQLIVVISIMKASPAPSRWEHIGNPAPRRFC